MAKEKTHELRAMHKRLAETEKTKEMEMRRVRIEQTEKKVGFYFSLVDPACGALVD